MKAYRTNLLGLLGLMLFSLCGCGGGGSGSSTSTRSYYLGVTPFPYSITQPDGLSNIYATLPQVADMTVHEFDGGIPWAEAVNDTYPYNSNLMGDWNLRKANTPAGQKVFLQLNPIDLGRSHLANFWNGSGQNQPLDVTWNGYALNAPQVKQAFLNYCLRAIAFFQPAYLGIGIEVNQLMMNSPSKWANYLDLHIATYQALKARYPTLPIFVSMTAVDLLPGITGANAADQTTALNNLLPYEDYFGISVYLYLSTYLTNSIPSGAFDQLAALSSKQIFITESGYPAQSFTTAGPPSHTFTTTPAKQETFVQLLLAAADKYRFAGVVSYLVRDYDSSFGNADTTLAFRYIGLYDGSGNPRPSATDWKAKLALKKSP